MIRCCSCPSPLRKIINGLDLLGCEECNLLWFSQGQLEKLDLRDERLSAFAQRRSVAEPQRGCLCPTCAIPMHFHQFPTAPHVVFGECYQCGGSFLSSEQLREIRENQLSPEDLEAYRGRLAHSIDGFTEAEHTRMNRRGLGSLARKWKRLKSWRKTTHQDEG